MDDLTSLTDSYLEAKAVISLGRNPFPAALLADLPDLAGIPIPKVGGSGAARPGAEGPDRRPTIPPASGSGATSSGAEGPDRPSATRGPGYPGPGGAARGSALDDEQACRRGPHLCGPLGPTTGPRTRPGLGQQPHQGESGGAGKGYASQEPPGGWTPMGQVLY